MTGRYFGFECEVASGATAVLDRLVSSGLAGDKHLHSYHCSCEACEPFRQEHAITGQEDCTVDGELISKVLTYGSDEMETVLDGLSAALLQSRAGLGSGAGFHVHVNRQDMDTADHARLFRMFLRYQDDLGELAAASFGEVRDYNCPLRVTSVYESGLLFWELPPDELREMRRPPKGCWLAQGHPETFEFRLWNQSLSRWRMRTAVGVSVAMVEAAKAGVLVDQHDKREFIDVIGDHVDADTLAGIIRQSNYKEK